MSKAIKTKYITEISVIDPDTQNEIKLVIYKLETGGMIGIDASFDGDIYSPFDKNIKLDIQE